METIYQPLEHHAFDYDKLSRNMGTCVPDGGKFALNSDALALVRGTLTPDNLDKVIKRVTVILNWDLLAKNVDLSACFAEVRTRDLSKAIKGCLEDMVRNRNRIVHSTGIAAEIEEPQVREQLRFVRAFCHSISACVKADLAKKIASCKRTK